MCSRIIHFPLGLLSRLTILALLSATLPGCTVITDNIIKDAQGEKPKLTALFALAASVDTYEITRKVGEAREKTLIIPRRDLPAGCEVAHFFINNSSTASSKELQIAQRVWANWVTEIQPSLPDDSYPPCSLLVSYGTFSGPPVLEGVAVTSANGIVATSEREQPHPAKLALVPLGVVADVFIDIGALVTFPVWVTIGIIREHSATKREQEAKDKEKTALPLPVAACWTDIDNVMKNTRASNADPFSKFEWASGKENAYALSTANEEFSDDKPVPIDSRVTLRHGRVQFEIEGMRPRWTNADVECGLRAGDVVANRVDLRK